MIAEYNPQIVLAIFLGTFLLTESLWVIWKITHNHGPLHISKYVFTGLVGFWLCIKALISGVDWLEIAEAAALAAFVAEGLLWRLGKTRLPVENA